MASSPGVLFAGIFFFFCYKFNFITHQSKLSISSWFNLKRLYVSRNLSIFYGFPSFWQITIPSSLLWFFFFLYLCVYFFSSISYFVLVSLFFLVSLAKHWSILSFQKTHIFKKIIKMILTIQLTLIWCPLFSRLCARFWGDKGGNV